MEYFCRLPNSSTCKFTQSLVRLNYLDLHYRNVLLIFLCGWLQRIPVWWRWFYGANPMQWTLYGVIASQLGDIDTPTDNPDVTGTPQSVKQYLEDNLGYKHDFLGVVVGMHLIWTLMFLFTYAYRFVDC